MAVVLGHQTIEASWKVGRTTHATLAVTLEAFATFASERADTWAGALDRAADMYFACACALGAPGAAELFLAGFGERMPRYLARLGTSEDQIDEVRQIVLVRCLVSDGERPPAITGFSGRGSLEGWVRATAIREALALGRDRARHVELAGAMIEPAVDRDPESHLIRHYRDPVARAFTAATAALPREHRALLRLHYVYGLTTAQLAEMFRVSRATLVRRITDARDALFERLQGELFGQAGVPPEDCESLLRLVRSQVDLRLSYLLRETAA